ncbi:hypothetical protein BH11ARM2_BH11ARM2_08410 [soil metagenome]
MAQNSAVPVPLGLLLALMPLQADDTYTCRFVRPSLVLNLISRKPLLKEENRA